MAEEAAEDEPEGRVADAVTRVIEACKSFDFITYPEQSYRAMRTSFDFKGRHDNHRCRSSRPHDWHEPGTNFGDTASSTFSNLDIHD